MNKEQIPEIAAYTSLGVKVVGAYLQSRFPDAKTIRNISIPAHALGALSYGCMGATMAMWGYIVPTVRSSIRTTKWGAEHKKLVAICAASTMTGLTAVFAKSAADLLPLAAVYMGTVMDYQKQGRYQRLPGFTVFSTIWAPVAAAKGNWGLLAAEVFQSVMIAKGIKQHDINNAAGPNQPFSKNWKAYCYGIFNNAATGASKAGQVSTDKGHEPIEEQYKELLQTKPNPYFKPEPSAA